MLLLEAACKSVSEGVPLPESRVRCLFWNPWVRFATVPRENGGHLAVGLSECVA